MNDFIGTGNETPEEILALLQANADETDTMTYTRFFTEPELQDKNEEFLSKSIEFRKLSEELDEVKKTFKGKMDPLKVATNGLLTELHNKGEIIKNGDVFIIIDQEEGRVGTYSPEGKLLSERGIKKSELRQPGLFSLPKKQPEITIKPGEVAATGTEGAEDINPYKFKNPGREDGEAEEVF